MKRRRILITGAARRIGKALALYFLEQNWEVIAHYNNSQSDYENWANALPKDLKNAISGYQADLTDAKARDALLDFAMQDSALDALINSAAIFQYDRPDKIDYTLMEHALSTNLIAPLALCDGFYHRLSQNDQTACAINLLDNKLFALNPDYFSYSIAKAGLHAASQMMASQYGATLRINNIAPGITLRSGEQSNQDFDETSKISPLGQTCTPDDIAKAALFLVDSPNITGQTICIDGGQILWQLPRDVAFLNPNQNGEPT